ncbi:MAG: hypothetical protein KDE45_16925 [Caldilineaceae bacterium]|nr:hypothetical protein [Caldilineaceae bacterium]
MPVDYLTHYYMGDREPFQSLSALPDAEAIRIMAALSDDTPFGARFKQPHQYLAARRDSEAWVRAEFIAKGGRPQAGYPISCVLGSSGWLEQAAPERAIHAAIRIPLALFTADDVSFTYPDSMISRWFGRDKPAEYYRPALHGRVFTLPEILALVAEKGMPEEHWDSNLPVTLAPYIEAQVWNHEVLAAFRRQQNAGVIPDVPAIESYQS